MTDSTAAPPFDPTSKPVNPAPKPEDYPHEWVAAVNIPLTRRAAKKADFRGSLTVEDLDLKDKVNVLETLCDVCRRPFEDVDGKACEGKIDNQHLIGGDQRERMKRKTFQVPQGAMVRRVPGPTIHRYGIDAVIRGEL